MNTKMISKLSVVTLTALLSVASARAAIIAIADSGTDVKHDELKTKLWTNKLELDNAVDNDDNGKIGDVHGWNFIDGNNRYYEKKLLGTFPPDVYKFFEVQTRMLKGLSTDEDKKWIDKVKGDKEFLAKLNEFGEFVHGTHVAGIASKSVDAAQIMALKVIGKKTAFLFESAIKLKFGNVFGGDMTPFKDKIVRYGLDYLAKAQGQSLGPVAEYLDEMHAQVVNCSFGSSTAALKPMIGSLLKIVAKNITEDQVNEYLVYLMNQMVEVMEHDFVLVSPHTLFVIAAGNDGTNNDVAPTSPANVRLDNAITVAATMENQKLASFSNYGNVHVDIAAPGVGILSTTPGNTHLLLSGTSQATPAVTNVAGQILDANPKLSPSEVKRVLMETVDHQAWLEGKVKSEGTMNGARAVYAAKASTSMSLAAAIAEANAKVAAETVAPAKATFAKSIDEKNLYVVPLPALLR
ncbi:MAG: S8 family serine peptidase [Bdellovibrionales bacterium]|nr:S8 family serine peptidase [Bdellovibrionales bacterium]